MLATCVHNNWSHDDSYLSESHPLQQRVTQMVPELSGEEAAFIGIDGCGAPAHAMSLTALARVFRTVVMSDPTSAPGKVADAMRSHPEMVGGSTRDVTLLMQGVPGLLGKDGAEGVFAVAMPDGRAVALKIADDAYRHFFWIFSRKYEFFSVSLMSVQITKSVIFYKNVRLEH